MQSIISLVLLVKLLAGQMQLSQIVGQLVRIGAAAALMGAVISQLASLPGFVTMLLGVGVYCIAVTAFGGYDRSILHTLRARLWRA